MKAYLKQIAYYLPDNVLSNDDLNKLFPEWSSEKISRKTGIYSRHIAGEKESIISMASKAAEKLFQDHNMDRSKIDFILLCTQSPDYFLPTTACVLQDKLGLSTDCGALDFNLGCSGFVYGLGLAKGLVLSGQAKNVLLITAETYSRYLHNQDKGNRTIFGDASAAALISSENDGLSGEILDFVHGTDGAGANSLIVKNKTPIHTQDQYDEYGNIISDNHLYMDGRDVFNFTLKRVPELIEKLIDKHGYTKDSIDLFVFHQANRFMLNHLRKKIKIEEDKFYLFLENCGNTVSSTIPIALYEAMKDESISQGKSVLLAGFGVGLSWSGVILNY